MTNKAIIDAEQRDDAFNIVTAQRYTFLRSTVSSPQNNLF